MSIDAYILIVDDDVFDLEPLKNLLEHEGYKVHIVENTQTAIDSAFLNPPELIILNVHKPGMNGFKVCQHLKEDKRMENIPMIFISGSNDTEIKIRGFEAGCVDFITKPFQEPEVLARVKTQMGLRKMKQTLEKQVEERTAELSKSKAILEHSIRELKKKEEELRLSEERYELAVLGSDAGIWDWDMVKDVAYFSDQFKSMLGYSDKDWSIVSLQDFMKLIHAEDVESVDKKLSEYISQGKGKFNNVYRLQTKSGQYRWFQVSGQAIWDENGIPIRASGSSVDIHEHKLAESELRISEERYELAVAGSEVGIWDYNFRTDKSYYSDRFKELMGYDPQELKNLTLEEAVSHLHPDFREKLHIALQDHLEGNSPFYFIDYKVRMKSGEYRWFQARGKATWDDQGQPIRVAGSFVDIHEQKLAEEELKKSERHFRHLMDSTPLSIAIFSPEGNINQVNAAWKKLWGMSEQEAIQVMAEYNIITDKQLEDLGLTPLVKRAFEGESTILPPITYQWRTTTDESGLEEIEAQSHTIQVHIHSVKDDKGEIEYVVGINVDLTKLKQAEAEVEGQRESLARLDRTSSMGQLTGSIAHELNQPLTGILSNAQAAEILVDNDTWTTENLHEIISAIVSDTKRASNVIRNLREMYREHRTESFPFEIDEIANQTLQLLNSELITNNIHLVKKFDPTIPKAEGNVVQIQQVLVNLIMNAIQATMHLEKADRQLGIATESEENEIKAWVEDNGPGIDPDKIDHIFEPFSTWKPGGTGMGLAISNSIITGHGGSMWAENLEEGGCRVGFILPVKNVDNNT